MNFFLTLTISAMLLLACGTFESKKKNRVGATWEKIDTGLDVCHFNSPIKSEWADNKITVLRIDPKFYNFSLVSAKEEKCKAKTVKQWAKEKKLLAVINAGMFLNDDLTNTGYMKNYGFLNNPVIGKDNTIIAFNRKDTTVGEFQVIDRECQDWETLSKKYETFSQGIRMIDCDQNNKWSLQEKKWSMVCLGTDKKGNALFIFCRSPYRVHDFVNILLKLPIYIHNAQYLEGGPEASLYVDCKGHKIEKFGSYETNFIENDDNKAYWKIPNVIGITKK
jgi:exopolysaccharide biosynthesis protein